VVLTANSILYGSPGAAAGEVCGRAKTGDLDCDLARNGAGEGGGGGGCRDHWPGSVAGINAKHAVWRGYGLVRPGLPSLGQRVSARTRTLVDRAGADNIIRSLERGTGEPIVRPLASETIGESAGPPLPSTGALSFSCLCRCHIPLAPVEAQTGLAQTLACSSADVATVRAYNFSESLSALDYCLTAGERFRGYSNRTLPAYTPDQDSRASLIGFGTGPRRALGAIFS